MRKENLVMILLHYFVNLFMLGPLFVTGDFWKPAKSDSTFFSAENVYTRHQENINAGLNIFDKEKEVVSMLTTMEWAMPLTIHLASILDILLAFVYRKYLHPWRRILEVINNICGWNLQPQPFLRKWTGCHEKSKIFVKGQVNYNHLLLNKRSPEHHLLWIQKWRALSPTLGDFWC